MALEIDSVTVATVHTDWPTLDVEFVLEKKPVRSLELNKIAHGWEV